MLIREVGRHVRQADIVPLCRELGIAIVAYSPLGRGFLTGAIEDPKHLHEDDWRAKGFPRFHDEHFWKVTGSGDRGTSFFVKLRVP